MLGSGCSRCVATAEMVEAEARALGVKTLDGLPPVARAYIKRMEELCGVPVDMISTGPDREETIVLRHPFK